jgi:signal transduction histidine kinase
MNIYIYMYIYRNFLSNAVKFTPEHGTISVYVDSLNSETGENLAVISVTDSGVGLSEENLRHLFEEGK